jgi:hypothetical protein
MSLITKSFALALNTMTTESLAAALNTDVLARSCETLQRER